MPVKRGGKRHALFGADSNFFFFDKFFKLEMWDSEQEFERNQN
jgi:hypothetical protein